MDLRPNPFGQGQICCVDGQPDSHVSPLDRLEVLQVELHLDDCNKVPRLADRMSRRAAARPQPTALAGVGAYSGHSKRTTGRTPLRVHRPARCAEARRQFVDSWHHRAQRRRAIRRRHSTERLGTRLRRSQSSEVPVANRIARDRQNEGRGRRLVHRDHRPRRRRRLLRFSARRAMSSNSLSFVSSVPDHRRRASRAHLVRMLERPSYLSSRRR